MRMGTSGALIWQREPPALLSSGKQIFLGNHYGIQKMRGSTFPFHGILVTQKKEWSKHYAHAATQMNLENVMLSEGSQSQRPHAVWLHLCDMFGLGKCRDRK